MENDDNYDDIFNGIKIDLFSSIIDNKNENKKIYTNCFINILIQEVNKEKNKKNNQIQYNNLIPLILQYVFDSNLIDDCIPLIDLLFSNFFFSGLNINSNPNQECKILLKMIIFP